MPSVHTLLPTLHPLMPALHPDKNAQNLQLRYEIVKWPTKQRPPDVDISIVLWATTWDRPYRTHAYFVSSVLCSLQSLSGTAGDVYFVVQQFRVSTAILPDLPV